MEMNNIPWSPVLRYATPLPLNRTPVSIVALQHKSVSSVLRYARPLLMNRIPFRTWPVEQKAVSSVLRCARPRFHRLFHPSPPDEHDDAFCSDPAGWLPMKMATTQFLHSDPAMYTSPVRTYARAGIRDSARMYVHGRIFWRVATCTCTRFRWDILNCYVGGSTMTRVRLYIDQYVRTRSQPE